VGEDPAPDAFIPTGGRGRGRRAPWNVVTETGVLPGAAAPAPDTETWEQRPPPRTVPDAAEPAPEVVLRPPAPGRANPWLAALASAGFRFDTRQDENGCEIRVPSEKADAARAEIDAVERLNQNWPPPMAQAQDAGPQYGGDWSVSLGVAAGLLMLHWSLGPQSQSASVLAQGCAASGRMLAGEWWRAITALTLHADATHVLGNAVCCLFFGHAVSRQLGTGLGWLLILLSGAAGNWCAAHLVDAARTSIGASTATFGAVGLLCALQFVRNFRAYGGVRSVWNRTWVPLAAAVAMLALLGTGWHAEMGPPMQTTGRIDIEGHLCGLLAGLALGTAAAIGCRKRIPNAVQFALGLAAMLCVWGAWTAARRAM
jgi:membrane associated rhomboid family serine protease